MTKKIVQIKFQVGFLACMLSFGGERRFFYKIFVPFYFSSTLSKCKLTKHDCSLVLQELAVNTTALLACQQMHRFLAKPLSCA